MRVIITAAHLAALEAHLEHAYPGEGAGFVLGRIAGEQFLVEGVLPLRNRWEAGGQHNRFKLTGQDALQGEIEASQLGVDVIGVFHSHPEHPAEPSKWDLAWATWPNFCYLITTVVRNSTHGGKAQITRAWRLREDRSAFEEDVLEVR